MTLSVIIITYNEEANLGRTLESVLPLVGDGKGEIIVVDSGSTDRTVEIARSCGAKVFIEPWKGYAAQKNLAIERASGDWILSLDADEEVTPELARVFSLLFAWRSGKNRLRSEDADWLHDRVSLDADSCAGFLMPRRNFFLGRWVRHGGFYPDRKLRLWTRGAAAFENRSVHETAALRGQPGIIRADLIHRSYPTLSDYIDHMNRYSSLGAEMVAEGNRGFSVINIAVRPVLTFVYNYFCRLGFLDGREGLLLHLYHSVYVSWKYAKAWELARARRYSLPT